MSTPKVDEMQRQTASVAFHRRACIEWRSAGCPNIRIWRNQGERCWNARRLERRPARTYAQACYQHRWRGFVEACHEGARACRAMADQNAGKKSRLGFAFANEYLRTPWGGGG